MGDYINFLVGILVFLFCPGQFGPLCVLVISATKLKGDLMLILKGREGWGHFFSEENTISG